MIPNLYICDMNEIDTLRGRIKQAYFFATDPKNHIDVRINCLISCGEDIDLIINPTIKQELENQSIH
jgi:hypothetical protein